MGGRLLRACLNGQRIGVEGGCLFLKYLFLNMRRRAFKRIATAFSPRYRHRLDARRAVLVSGHALTFASAAMRFHDSSWAGPMACFSCGVRLAQNAFSNSVPFSAISFP
jgi:hypothetical protein